MNRKQRTNPHFLTTLVVLLAMAAGMAQAQRDIRPIAIVRKQALIIGNSDYPNAALANPGNDARLMQTTLEELGFDVRTLYDLNLRQMEEAIDQFTTELTSGGFGFFYYAGHGIQVDSVNYLVPVDFAARSQADVKYEAYPASRIKEKMEDSGARLRVLVLDACRNNPFRYGRDSTSGLAPMSVNAEGTLVAYATGDNNIADDNPAEPNGLYTKHLISAMNSPGMALHEIFRQAKEEVYRASGRRQNPSIYENVVGEFYFTLPEAPPVESAQESTFDAAQETWSLIRDSEDPADFDRFREAFPDSGLALAAEIRARQLRAAVTAEIPAEQGEIVATVPEPEALGVTVAETVVEPQASQSDIADWIATGKAAHESGDYDTALVQFRNAAQVGDAEAMNWLGWMYQNAQGVEQDHEIAIRLYRDAAVKGNSSGMFNVGWLYEQGLGVRQNYGEALTWYREAADAGESMAMNNIGLLLENGRGIGQNYSDAMDWYRRAADAGNTMSMYNLGVMLEEGRGVEADSQQAVDWYQRAVSAGAEGDAGKQLAEAALQRIEAANKPPSIR